MAKDSRNVMPDSQTTSISTDLLKRVLIGGNHLGLLIGADHPPHTASCGEALEHYVGDHHDHEGYEAWCAWRAIMELSRVVDI